MPKKPTRLSPRQSGRRVRWTFEVSADIDAGNRARVKRTARKPSARSRSRQDTPSNPEVQGPQQVAAPPTPWHLSGAQMATVAGAVVLVIAMVEVPRRPTPSDTPRPPQKPELRHDAAAVSPTVAARPVAKSRDSREPSEMPPRRSVTSRPVERERPALPASAMTTATLAENEPTPKPAAPEPLVVPPAPAPPASLPSLVTISGCLEISTDGNEFRLADTDGVDAPKARSWRTGFLRKRTAPVAVVGAPDPQALKKSVGKRVEATGVLTSRALQVSSVRVLGSACN